ncbi:MAG: lipase secretion chaperone [Alcanivoracaceae bacterium]|nr:lipase secretion chaperone [Alcanivoracaceae bacterium]
MPKNKRWLVFSLCLLMLTISLALVLTSSDKNAVVSQSIASANSTQSVPSQQLNPSRRAADASPAFDLFSLEEISTLVAASSLDGTEAPGTLQLDRQGKLIIDSSTKDILDYFLSLSGEMPNDRIHKIIFSWAHNTASLSAANELMDILERYQTYQQTFASGDYAASDLADISQKMAARRAMRDEIMGTRISTDMFANDDAYDEYSMARLTIMQSTRNDADKQKALGILSASLSPEIAREIHQQHSLRTLPEVEETMKASGDTDAEIYTYRQQEFGAAAAQRLESLDQQRSQWQQRYQTYKERKEQITRSGLAAEDQQSEITKLREEMFDQTEQLRISAMERIDANI